MTRDTMTDAELERRIGELRGDLCWTEREPDARWFRAVYRAYRELVDERRRRHP